MNKFFYTTVFALCMAVLFSPVVRAEDCSLPYGMISTFKDDPLGSYNVWDGLFGSMEETERFATGVAAPNRTVIVVGDRYSHEDDPREMILVKMDKRGRVMWEKSADVEDLIKVIKILPHTKGYMVMANLHKTDSKKERIWFGTFDTEGNLLSEATIGDQKFDLEAHDIIEGKDDNEFLIAVSAKRDDLEKTENAVIYRVNAEGKVQSYNGYAPGLQNGLLDLVKMPEGGYLATGFITNEEGRRSGWVVRLNESGSIKWQSQYARGILSSLNAGANFIDNHIIVAGETHPIGAGERAAWVMALRKGTGNVSWQRYYRGNLAYGVRDIIAYPDGLISVMIDGRPAKGDTKSLAEVRMVTLSPRGATVGSGTYLNGHGANASQMIQGPNMDHILIGHSRAFHHPYRGKDKEQEKILTPEEEEELREDDNNYSVDGWVLAAPPNDPYTDPCKLPYNNVEE